MVLELNKYEYPLVLNNTTFETNLTIMFWIKLDNNRNTRELLIGTNPFIFAIILEKSLSNQISFYCGNGTKIMENMLNIEHILVDCHMMNFNIYVLHVMQMK